MQFPAKSGMNYMERRKNDRNKNSWIIILADYYSTWLGIFVSEDSRKGSFAKSFALCRGDTVNWIHSDVCTFRSDRNPGYAACGIPWIFQNGNIVCCAADCRGRNRVFAGRNQKTRMWTEGKRQNGSGMQETI